MSEFIGAACAFLLKHWKLIGLAALALALAVSQAQLKSRTRQRDEARAALYVPDAAGKPTKLTWRAKAEAAERDLDTCQANGLTLQRAIDGQNASLAAAAAEGRQRTADAEKAVQAARGATAKAEKAATSILNRQPVGVDTCARVLDVDRQFLEALR